MAAAPVVTTTVTRTCSSSHQIVLALPAQQKQLSTDQASQVSPGLLIGSRESERSLSALQAAGVTHILQCGVELMPSHAGRFVYKHLSLCDREEQDIIGVFDQAFHFINKARKTGTVLVHCAQGISRSAAVAIGYLMKHSRISYAESLAQLKQVRPEVNPNEGFVQQLQKFECLNCNVQLWTGWDQQKLERALRESSVSGRRIVHGLSDIIRRFHVHDDEDDESTVFFDTSVLL